MRLHDHQRVGPASLPEGFSDEREEWAGKMTGDGLTEECLNQGCREVRAEGHLRSIA